ncbi:MAG: histidine phosphatase family protein [Cyclobacteriaceae bacterium]
MKTLYLIRHAKSSWAFDLDDHDRPLGPRGRKAIGKMGKYLKKHVAAPNLIITSTASRAFYTALHLADYWEYSEEQIMLSNRLYHCSFQDIEGILGGFSSEDCIAIVGHNPTFTQFHNRFSDKPIDNIPTCGIVGLEFDINSWKEIMMGKARQTFFYRPKGI